MPVLPHWKVLVFFPPLKPLYQIESLRVKDLDIRGGRKKGKPFDGVMERAGKTGPPHNE